MCGYRWCQVGSDCKLQQMSHHRRVVVQTEISERVGRPSVEVSVIVVVPSARYMWTWCALNRRGREHLEQHTDR